SSRHRAAGSLQRCRLGRPLVVLAKKNERNSFPGMLGEPAAHFGDRPLPSERVRIEAVVLRPRYGYSLPDLGPVTPRGTLQVAPLKGVDERFRLIEPRGMRRSQVRVPPTTTLRQIVPRQGRVMTGATIFDQVDPAL